MQGGGSAGRETGERENVGLEMREWREGKRLWSYDFTALYKSVYYCYYYYKEIMTQAGR